LIALEVLRPAAATRGIFDEPAARSVKKARRIDSLSAAEYDALFHVQESSMTRGCLIGLFSWTAFAAGYWVLLHTRFPAPYHWIVPVGAGFVMAVVVGTLQAAIASGRAAWRLSRGSAFSGSADELPIDGEAFTVVGHIRASGPPLRAPFSGKAAVLYDYGIQHVGGQKSSRNDPTEHDYSGFALTPCAIDSPHGPIRLLGFPELENFDKERLDSEEALRNAAAYLSTTQFQDIGGFDPRTAFRESKELMSTDDGQLRKDWSISGERDLSNKQLFEQIVVNGDEVCAIGCYSAEKRALRPDLTVGSIRLLRGDPRNVARTLWWKTAHGIVGSVVITAALNGAIFGYLKFIA
jgi:hypothetical protein